MPSIYSKYNYLYQFSNSPIIVDTRKNPFKSTVNLPVSTSTSKQRLKDAISMQVNQSATTRCNIEIRRITKQIQSNNAIAPFGNVGEPVPTELYLEELVNRPIQSDVLAQTDMWLDIPPTPSYVPAKTGCDMETQIYKSDLFDFNTEVKPILEVLVGKTLEQSMLEVVQEELLNDIRHRMRSFEELRNADLAEVNRLTEQDRRIREEKDARLKQIEFQLRTAAETSEKVAVRAYTIDFCRQLVTATMASLNTMGFIYDPIERDIEENFMNKVLRHHIYNSMNNYVIAGTVLDEIIRNVVRGRKETYGEMERTQAEWKMIKGLEDRVYEGAYWLSLDDNIDTSERMLYLSMIATDEVLNRAVNDGIQKAINAHALEEAAARAAEAASKLVDDGDGDDM